jgi:hypothetical protein
MQAKPSCNRDLRPAKSSPREEFSLIARAGSRPADRRRARTPISEHRLRARLRSLTTRWKKELPLHWYIGCCLPQRKGRPGFNTILLQALFTSCYCCDSLTTPLLHAVPFSLEVLRYSRPGSWLSSSIFGARRRGAGREKDFFEVAFSVASSNAMQGGKGSPRAQS